MKEIKFRPLRRIKKTGKIMVASYAQWRKVKVCDYDEFILVIDEEYKSLPLSEYVYNHKGEVLFWRDYDPEQIPSLPPYILREDDYQYPRQWRTNHNMGYCDHWSAKGLDCDGVPTFNHYDQDYVATRHDDLQDFEPLTVGVVVKWFGWFLYQLRYSKLKSI